MKITQAHNNFTLLRLSLALMVVLGHFHTLPHRVRATGPYGLSDFAVDSFFVVSGYLIAQSFDRKPELRGFFIRRFFRLYPLYAFMIFVQAAIMLGLLGHPLAWLHDALRYIGANLVFFNFLAHNIGGLFASTPDPGINPSLWTLKIEVGFYLLLPLIWLVTRRFHPGLLIFLYVLSTLYYSYAAAHGQMDLAKQLPGQLRFFIIGIAIYRYADRIIVPPFPATCLAGLCLFAVYLRYDWHFAAIYPLCIGLFVFLVALRMKPIPLKTDISYGVYLIHAPLIQLSLLTDVYQDTPLFLAGLIAIVCLLASAAEYWVERPGIELGKRIERRGRGHSGAITA